MTRQKNQAAPKSLIPIKEVKLLWWVVWRSDKDGVFRACHGFSEKSAEATARVLTKPGASYNGVNLNYAQTAWALQAPSKHKAILLMQAQWLSGQLEAAKVLCMECKKRVGCGKLQDWFKHQPPKARFWKKEHVTFGCINGVRQEPTKGDTIEVQT